MYSEENFKNLLDQLYDGVYVTDLDRKIIYWNKSAERITGYSAEEVIGKSCHENILVHTDEEGNNLCNCKACPAAEVMDSGNSTVKPVFVKHRSGHRVPVLTRIMPRKDSGGNVIGAIEVFTDNPSMVNPGATIDKLARLALVDKKTGLRNFCSAEMNLKLILQEVKSGISAGVFLIGIDEFSTYKATIGSKSSTGLLKVVAKTLQATLSSEEHLFQWAESEFLVILRNIDAIRLRMTALKWKGLIANSIFCHYGQEIRPTASVAVTIFTDEDTLESVVKRLDRLILNCAEHHGDCVSIDMVQNED